MMKGVEFEETLQGFCVKAVISKPFQDIKTWVTTRKVDKAGPIARLTQLEWLKSRYNYDIQDT